MTRSRSSGIVRRRGKEVKCIKRDQGQEPIPMSMDLKFRVILEPDEETVEVRV